MIELLSLHTKELSFDIPLSCVSATVVWGDGNVGKTLIYTKLQEATLEGKIKGNFVFINMETANNISLLANRTGVVFIIDDFDILRLVHPEIVTYLNQVQNQALVFGRMLDDLYVDKHYMYYAKQKGHSILFTPVIPHHLI